MGGNNIIGGVSICLKLSGSMKGHFKPINSIHGRLEHDNKAVVYLFIYLFVYFYLFTLRRGLQTSVSSDYATLSPSDSRWLAASRPCCHVQQPQQPRRDGTRTWEGPTGTPWEHWSAQVGSAQTHQDPEVARSGWYKKILSFFIFLFFYFNFQRVKRWNVPPRLKATRLYRWTRTQSCDSRACKWRHFDLNHFCRTH